MTNWKNINDVIVYSFSNIPVMDLYASIHGLYDAGYDFMIWLTFTTWVA